MKRREFIALLSGAAAVLPEVARAQQSAMPVVGFLNTASPEPFAYLVRAFHEGLGSAGYVEGRNVVMEYRWAEDSSSRLKEMAADLVSRRVDVIAATGGSPAVLEAKAATTTIPIVFQVGVDPVKLGLVASLNRPGGNVTGATMMASDFGPKRLEILRELVPKATSLVALINPRTPTVESQKRDLKSAADIALMSPFGHISHLANHTDHDCADHAAIVALIANTEPTCRAVIQRASRSLRTAYQTAGPRPSQIRRERLAD